MNKDEIHYELNKSLNIDKDQGLKKYSKTILSKARTLLKNPCSFDRSSLYAYRKKKRIPISMIEGAVLGMLIEKNNQTRKSIHDYHELSFQNNLKYAGLFFDETKIVTKFKKSKTPKKTLDAEAQITIKGAHLANDSDINRYSLRFLSDSQSSKDVFDQIKVKGPGIELQTKSSQTCLQSFKSDGKFSHTQVATEYEILFFSDANKETEIKISRNLANSFSIDCHQNKVPVERSTFTLRRPTRKMELEILFDPNDFHKNKTFNIGLIAFPGYLSSTRESDLFVENTSNLDSVDISSLDKFHWKWSSEVPPITGMKYGFQYNIEEVNRCLI